MTDEEFKKMDEFLNKTIFDVNVIMRSISEFQETYDLLYNYMKMGFEDEKVRKHKLNYKFSKDTNTYSMEIRHFIVNMLFWYPMMKMEISNLLNKDFVIDCSCLNKKQIMKYFNYKIIEPYRSKVSSIELNQIFADTIYRLGQISLDFNEIMAITINIQTFIGLEEGSEEFSDLIHTKFATTMQPAEIETMLHERTERLVNIMKHTKNDLQPILNSEEGIKTKQLSEFAISGGLKPDMIGNTIPIPIDSNYLVGGLNSVKNFYIDKQSGRKAVVINKTQMGNAGHFAAKMMKVAKDTRVDFHTFDCGTHFPIDYFVADDAHLKIINRSFYYLPNDEGNLKVINYMKDKWLIGKMIKLRLPCTCGLRDNKVCPTCYGEMYKVNDDPMFGHGSYGAAISGNKIQQDTLSIKHLQTTRSITIEFPDKFYDIFKIDSATIIIDPSEIDEPNRWLIKIDNQNLVEFDQLEFNSYTNEIILVDKITGEEFSLIEKNGGDIFLYQDIIENFSQNNNFIELDIGKIEDELMLGIIIIENDEITKPLKNLQNLLDTKKHFNCYNDINAIINRAADLIIESDINVMLVHFAMVIKNLIRKEEDIYQYPNFSVSKDQPYVVLKLTEALIHNPSLTTGLSSQNLRTQLSNPITYMKHAKSTTDSFFKKSLV